MSKSALGFCICSFQFWSLVSISLISVLILLFLLLANLIVWPLMTHLIESHKREGLAPLLVSFTSSITCLTSSTYSKSYKRLQLNFQYPGRLLFHMPSRRVRWKNGQSQTHMIFQNFWPSTNANETRKKVQTADNFSFFFCTKWKFDLRYHWCLSRGHLPTSEQPLPK